MSIPTVTDKPPQQEDVSSLESVFRSNYKQLWRMAALMVADAARAEELVMDAFAHALRDWNRGRGRENPPAYLRVAVVNRCRDHLRRRTREWRVNELSVTATPAPYAPVDADHDVLAAVQQLPPRRRAVVVLTYFDDLPESEVARTLGISVGTVKSQLSKARRTLAAHLSEES